jgi:hypothetical protein
MSDAFDWFMPVISQRTTELHPSDLTNYNPKLASARAVASEVRARRPEMQVKRITRVAP